ncbi:MAG: hypothetical protein V1646_04480 [bacterium]
MISARYKKYLIFLLLVLAQNSANGMLGQKELQKKLGSLKGSLTELKRKLTLVQGKLEILQDKLAQPAGHAAPPPPPPMPKFDSHAKGSGSGHGAKTAHQSTKTAPPRTDLLKEIQTGKQLKHVVPQELETETTEKVKVIVSLFKSLDLENPNKEKTEEIFAKINEFKIDLIKKSISEIEKKDPKFINKLKDAASKINISWENFDLIKSIIIPSSLEGVLQQALKAKFQQHQDDEDESGDDTGWDDETPAYTPKVEKKQEQTAAAPAPKPEEKKKDEGKGTQAPTPPVAKTQQPDKKPAAKPAPRAMPARPAKKVDAQAELKQKEEAAKLAQEKAAAEQRKAKEEAELKEAQARKDLLEKIDALIKKIDQTPKPEKEPKLKVNTLEKEIFEVFKKIKAGQILDNSELLKSWIINPKISEAINNLAGHEKTLAKFKNSLEVLKNKIQISAPKEPSAAAEKTSEKKNPVVGGPGEASVEESELTRSFREIEVKQEKKKEEAALEAKAEKLKEWDVKGPFPSGITSAQLPSVLTKLGQDLGAVKSKAKKRLFSNPSKEEKELLEIIRDFQPQQK